MCKRFYTGGPVPSERKNGGRIWPSQIEYKLVPGVGGLEDCHRCALYSLDDCSGIGGGCGGNQYWIVKEVRRV